MFTLDLHAIQLILIFYCRTISSTLSVILLQTLWRMDKNKNPTKCWPTRRASPRQNHGESKSKSTLRVGTFLQYLAAMSRYSTSSGTCLDRLRRLLRRCLTGTIPTLRHWQTGILFCMFSLQCSSVGQYRKKVMQLQRSVNLSFYQSLRKGAHTAIVKRLKTHLMQPS